jgi:hypothetical protein
VFKLIQIIKEINVEVTKPNIFQALVAKQYDMNTRFLKVTLMDCGNRIDVPYIETAKVVINAERKDGQSKGFEGTINEDGTVTVPLHSWMLELDGTVICDISVIDTATDDNKKLTTTSFTLIVEKAAFGGEDITNDPQFDVLVSLMEAATVAQEALDKSNEANSKYDACVEATENANEAANELGSIKAELANGGYIESFKEKNKGLYLGFWVGTQAEYDALETKPEDCYVIITDDPTVENINKKIEKIAIERTDHPGCFYRIIDDETEWLNPPMAQFVEYRTTERFLNKPVYTMTFGCLKAEDRYYYIRENGGLFIGNSPALVIDSNVMIFDHDENAVYSEDIYIFNNNGVPELELSAVEKIPDEHDLYATFKYVKGEI